MYKLLRENEDAPPFWNKHPSKNVPLINGRRRYLDKDEIKEFISRVHDQDGRVITETDVRNEIEKI